MAVPRIAPRRSGARYLSGVGVGPWSFGLQPEHPRRAGGPRMSVGIFRLHTMGEWTGGADLRSQSPSNRIRKRKSIHLQLKPGRRFDPALQELRYQRRAQALDNHGFTAGYKLSCNSLIRLRKSIRGRARHEWIAASQLDQHLTPSYGKRQAEESECDLSQSLTEPKIGKDIGKRRHVDVLLISVYTYHAIWLNQTITEREGLG